MLKIISANTRRYLLNIVMAQVTKVQNQIQYNTKIQNYISEEII